MKTTDDDDVDRSELEAERDFLLRSLDDLDAELAAGNIDAETYHVLRDDYTARAAAAIKSIDDGVEREVAEPARRPKLARFLTIGAIVVFVAAASYLLAHSAGQRQPGQTPTGNAQVNQSTGTVSPQSEVEAAKDAVKARPRDYATRIRYARALTAASNFPDAIREYVEATKIDPSQPEPLAYSGWITALVSRQVSDANAKQTLLSEATDRLNQAITVAPDYTDAYVFKGLLLSQIENRPCDAVPAFQRFLVLAPQAHPMRNQVLDALQQAVTAGKCQTSNTVSP